MEKLKAKVHPERWSANVTFSAPLGDLALLGLWVHPWFCLWALGCCKLLCSRGQGCSPGLSPVALGLGSVSVLWSNAFFHA